MNQRWSMVAMVFGTAVLLADGPFAYFKIETQLTKTQRFEERQSEVGSTRPHSL
jgi:hypothetical protein